VSGRGGHAKAREWTRAGSAANAPLKGIGWKGEKASVTTVPGKKRGVTGLRSAGPEAEARTKGKRETDAGNDPGWKKETLPEAVYIDKKRRKKENKNRATGIRKYISCLTGERKTQRKKSGQDRFRGRKSVCGLWGI